MYFLCHLYLKPGQGYGQYIFPQRIYINVPTIREVCSKFDNVNLALKINKSY